MKQLTQTYINFSIAMSYAIRQHSVYAHTGICDKLADNVIPAFYFISFIPLISQEQCILTNSVVNIPEYTKRLVFYYSPWPGLKLSTNDKTKSFIHVMFVFVQALKKNVFLYQDTYYTSSQMKKSCQNTNRNTRNRPQLYSQKWGKRMKHFV